MNKMNLGCGFDVKDGWFNVNHPSHEPVEGAIYLDALKDHIDAFNKFDFILINHVLCTMKPDAVNTLLGNVKNWLKEGGTVEVIDMDLLKVFHAYQDQRFEDIPIEEGNADAKLCFAISGYGTRLSLFTPMRMYDVLEDAGFRLVKQLESSDNDLRPKESLVFEAVK